jgi:hypothetical protein
MYIYKDARTSVILHGLSISGLGPEISRNGSGNFQYPGPQRVDPEMVFIFSVDSSRVDAISGLLLDTVALYSPVTGWKPKVVHFFFRDDAASSGNCYTVTTHS